VSKRFSSQRCILESCINSRQRRHGKEKITMSTLRSFSAWTCVVLAYALAGCATFEKCGLEGCPGDAGITAKVQAALNRHADLGAPDSISVQTLNHVVYLNGLVDDDLAKRTAVSVTKRVAGVTDVVNNIAISQ
jgi:osmotically-inducible protein OsmY